MSCNEMNDAWSEAYEIDGQMLANEILDNEEAGNSNSYVYDNPVTMSREVYQNGKLVVSYSMLMMMQKDHWPPPSHLFHMGANVGDWQSGHIY